jgi:CDP-4-dehydro-6-deoxyglucose reductase
MASRRNKAQLVSARPLSPSVRSLSFELEGGPLSFRAGQWVDVHVTTPQGVEKRAYSIASDPRDARLELAVTRVDEGIVSPLLHQLPLGAHVLIDGPHGFFTRDAPELTRAPALFVATGTGLAPLRSMLSEALLTDHPPFTLLFGCRTPADILWREELESWAAKDAGFRLEVTLSRAGSDWDGRVGYVQNHVAEVARALGKPHAYICGLNRMVSEVRSICKGELAFERQRIHTERYD